MKVCTNDSKISNFKSYFPQFLNLTTSLFVNHIVIGFVSTPTMKVAADIIIYGSPNKTDISSSITKKLEQSSESLLEGSLMAVEAATEMIVHSLDMNRDIYPKIDRDSIDLKEFLTEQCHNSVFDSYTSLLSDGKKINLISTPKEDIFFAWIERLQGMYFQMK